MGPPWCPEQRRDQILLGQRLGVTEARPREGKSRPMTLLSPRAVLRVTWRARPLDLDYFCPAIPSDGLPGVLLGSVHPSPLSTLSMLGRWGGGCCPDENALLGLRSPWAVL